MSEFGDLNRTTEYLVFSEYRVTTKTRQWSVLSKSSGDLLGNVKWYGPWRQFTLHAHDAIFNAGCLKDIEDFLKDAFADWQQNKKGDA